MKIYHLAKYPFVDNFIAKFSAFYFWNNFSFSTTQFLLCQQLTKLYKAYLKRFSNNHPILIIF